MKKRSKYLVAISSVALIIVSIWYFLLYPEEPWIKYNFAVRGGEINALADYLEGQEDFGEFSCIGDDVWLDRDLAPLEVRKIVQHHCRSSRIVMGEQTEFGSSYYLGWRDRWLNEYWIAVMRGADFDAFEPCSRWHKPRPLESCVVLVSDSWAIHYFNATVAGDRLQEFVEDVVQDMPKE